MRGAETWRSPTTLAIYEPPVIGEVSGLLSEHAPGTLSYFAALAGWIGEQGVPWAWFVHPTFRKRGTRLEQADRAFFMWARDLERRALRGRGRRRGMRWVRALEQQADGTAHVHALLADCRHLVPADFTSTWRWGGVDASPYDPSLNGLCYLLKHVERGAHVWFSSAVFRCV